VNQPLSLEDMLAVLRPAVLAHRRLQLNGMERGAAIGYPASWDLDKVRLPHYSTASSNPIPTTIYGIPLVPIEVRGIEDRPVLLIIPEVGL